MNAGDLGSMVCEGEAEGEFGNTLRLCSCDDLKGLDNTRDGLMLQAGILSFSVLTDNAKVHVIVSCFVAGNVLDEDNRSVDIEFLT